MVMLIYNWLEYRGNYSKISESLYEYFSNGPALHNNGAIVEFSNDNTNDSFQLFKKY